MTIHSISAVRLSSTHQARLHWFQENEGRLVSWPQPLRDGLLATKAKGIYKPADLDVALSVRSMLSSPYADEHVRHLPDASWTWRYYQESQNPMDRDSEYTNRGLMSAMDQSVPVGILLQESPKPVSRYRVLGLGLPVDWNAGYFTFESATLI